MICVTQFIRIFHSVSFQVLWEGVIEKIMIKVSIFPLPPLVHGELSISRLLSITSLETLFFLFNKTSYFINIFSMTPFSQWDKAFFRQIQSQKIQITGTISIKERLCLYYEESPRGGKLVVLISKNKIKIKKIHTTYYVWRHFFPTNSFPKILGKKMLMPLCKKFLH